MLGIKTSHLLQTTGEKTDFTYPSREIDKLTGFKTRNLLCVPIHSDKGIIGVTEMVNKKLVIYGARFFEEGSQILTKQKLESTVFLLLIG